MQDRQSEDQAELERIRSVYESYAGDARKQRAWADGTAHRFQLKRKWARIREGLRRENLFPPESCILDLGVGSGTECLSLLESGFRPEALIALDLSENRVRSARVKYRWLRAMVGDGTRLPFRDESFDVVYQSTMVSSVLDASRRAAILKEAGRVLRPGGAFITDNLIWGGRVLTDDSSPETVAIRRFTSMIAESDAWDGSVIPIRDGLMLAIRK